MPITLQEVKTQSDFRKFAHFPHSLYKNHPYFVPSLISDELSTLHPEKNPAFDHSDARCWLAFEGSKPVGRVAAILNRHHIEKWDQAYLRFGWLDFVDNQEVSAALMGAVENWARKLGLSAVHGPLGFTGMDHSGLLVEGFDKLATLATIYNYPYYPEHLEKLGYIKDIDWVEFELTMPEKLDERIQRAAKIVLKRNNLHMLEIKRKKDLLEHTHALFGLVNSEYRKLYGSIALTDPEIEYYTKAYFSFVQPEFVPMIMDENNEMVAFGVAIPSLSRAMQKSHGRLFPFGWAHLLHALRKNDRADLYLIAVKEKYRGQGVNMVLINHIYQVFQKMGIQKIETNPELENNLNVQSQWKSIEKRQHKRRRVYIKSLT